MKTIFKYKRFSVDFNGVIVAAFDNEQDARDFVRKTWHNGIATVYDHEQNGVILTEVLI